MGLKKIIEEHLVLPILHLLKTHPDHRITKKGYKTLVDNTITDIREHYLKLLPKKKKFKDIEAGYSPWDVMVGYNQALEDVKKALLDEDEYNQ